MGIFNTAKMIQQAMQAKKKMQKIQVVGYSGIVKGIVIDGLYNVVAVEIDRDLLQQNYNLDQKKADEISSKIEEDIKNAFFDAKKQLEKQMSQSTSIEDLKNLLQ